MRSVELFSGCGGLALGLSRMGFHHAALVEKNTDAAATVEHNRKNNLAHVAAWPAVLAEDVRKVDWRPFHSAEVVAGGPPCQPFGIGGKARGHEDERDMWPEAVRAVREIHPRGFGFENVSGFLRPRFAGYVEWVSACLAHPDMPRQEGENHAAHLARLRSTNVTPSYRVLVQSVNAADYGAPQIRKRVVVGGLRHDEPGDLGPIPRTHSRERLLWEQWVTGEYWRRHGLSAEERKPARSDEGIVKSLRNSMIPPPLKPWVTVRDTLTGLGEPTGEKQHTLQPGARVYPGHTGSPLDMPAKALKAGDHGVPGGENMMCLDNGSVRYFTLREAARLMGLPDEYSFPRSWTESMRQMGNAVPVQLGEAVGRWLRDLLAIQAITKAA